MTNCTVSGNFGGLTGGVLNSGTLTAEGCTVSGNFNEDAVDGAGGIVSFGTLTLNNSIVAYNGDSSQILLGVDPDISGAVAATSSNNLIGIGSAANLAFPNSSHGLTGITNGVNGNQIGAGFNQVGIPPINPELGPLQDNGGPTYTMALLSGSSAIDAGDNDLIPADITTDQRGLTRIINDVVDIGAFEVQASADLSVTNSGPPTTTAGAAAGFDYTLVVTNNGPSDNAGGFTVTDVLPSAVTFQSTGSTAGANVTGQTVTFTNTTGLASAASLTYVIHVSTAPSVADATMLQDIAIVASSGTIDPNGTNDTSNIVSTAVLAQADLSISNSGPSTTIAGAAAGFNYVLTVTNNGPSNNVGGFTVTDVLPAGTIYQSAGSTAGANVSGQTITYTNSVGLISGGTQTYTIHVTTSSSLASGTLHDSATLVTAGASPNGATQEATPNGAAIVGTTDPNSANNTSNTVDTTVSAEADLTLTNTDGQTTAVPGQSVTYTVTVANTGPSDAPGTSIADTLPAGASYTVAQTGGANGATSGTGSFNQTVNVVSGGAVTYTIVVPISSSATGSLTNTASVTPPMGVTDTNNTTSITDTDTLTPTVNLTISNDDNQTTAVPGMPITYRIIVGNTGPSDAPGVGITDTIPATITGVAFTKVVAGGATGATNGSGNSLSQNVNLPSGSSVTYTVTGTIDPSATGSLVNTASLTVPASVTDTNLTTSASDTDTLTPQADLTLSKTDNQTSVVPGSDVTYTIIVSNTGPSAAPGTTITDTFAALLSGAAYTVTAAGGATGATSGTGDISQTVNLPAGSGVTYTVTGTVPSSAVGTWSNTATVAAASGVADGNLTNDSATDVDTLTPRVDLSITKDDYLTLLTPITPTTAYTMVVTNSGPSDAVGATVADMLPPAVSGSNWTATFAGSASGNSNGTGSINETVNIPASASITYTLSATIASGFLGSLVNTATVTPASGETDTNPANNSATDTDMVTKATTVIHAFDAGGVYTGRPFAATGSVYVGTTIVATPTFTYYNLSDKTLAHPQSGAPVNAGSYFFLAKFAGNSSLFPTQTTSGPITITKASSVIHASDLGGVYNGKPYAATGFVYFGSTSVATPVFHYYLLSDKAESHPLAAAPTNPGKYFFTATYAGGTNFQPTATSSGEFDIKIPVTSFVASPVHFTVNATFSGTVATFSAPAALAASLFTATINWGDGTATTAGTVSSGATKGQFKIVGSHKWTKNGPFTMIITLFPTASAAMTTTGTAS